MAVENISAPDSATPEKNNPDTKPIRVAAGLIFNTKGEILLAQRKPNKSNGLFWEFPGGKLEKGEDAATALIREIREELGLELFELKLISAGVTYYPKDVEPHQADYCLLPIQAVAVGLPKHLTDHSAVVFVKPTMLKYYLLSPADVPLWHRCAAALGLL